MITDAASEFVIRANGAILKKLKNLVYRYENMNSPQLPILGEKNNLHSPNTPKVGGQRGRGFRGLINMRRINSYFNMANAKLR